MYQIPFVLKINKFIQFILASCMFYNYALFYKLHFYRQRKAKIGKKIKQMLSNTLRLNFCFLNFSHILQPGYHPKIIWHILENNQRNKCVCIHEIIWLVITKMKMKMKNRSNRCNIDLDMATNIVNIKIDSDDAYMYVATPSPQDVICLAIFMTQSSCNKQQYKITDCREIDFL